MYHIGKTCNNSYVCFGHWGDAEMSGKFLIYTQHVFCFFDADDSRESEPNLESSYKAPSNCGELHRLFT